MSLHPALQRRLANVFAGLAQDRQIIYATHSPYFIDFDSLAEGAEIARIYRRGGDCVGSRLSDRTRAELVKLRNDLNSPHAVGTNAVETFFLDDGVILVEGQEDVVFYGKLLKELGVDLAGSFYGWGVGGASKMPLITQTLKELGFERVAGIVDADQPDLLKQLQGEFPEYTFHAIPANSVRTKKATKGRDAVAGLLDEKGNLRPEHKAATEGILNQVNAFLKGETLTEDAEGHCSA